MACLQSSSTQAIAFSSPRGMRLLKCHAKKRSREDSSGKEKSAYQAYLYKIAALEATWGA